MLAMVYSACKHIMISSLAGSQDHNCLENTKILEERDRMGMKGPQWPLFHGVVSNEYATAAEFAGVTGLFNFNSETGLLRLVFLAFDSDPTSISQGRPTS